MFSLASLASLAGIIAPLVGLVNTGAGAWLKDWSDKRGRANAPDEIARKEAQVVQADADAAAKATDDAMHATDPKVKAKALEEMRERES